MGFKDVETARGSASTIYDKFLEYGDEGDFVGMDVARKYLQDGLHPLAMLHEVWGW